MKKQNEVLIKTKRLKLRGISENDYGIGVELFCDVELMKYLGEPWKNENAIETMKEWQNEWGNRNYYYGIIENEENKRVGIAGFSEDTNPNEKGIEIAWFAKKEFQGNGYATEMCNGMINYINEKNSDIEIFAEIDPENESAKMVLIRAGFEKMGIKEHKYDYLPGMNKQEVWKVIK